MCSLMFWFIFLSDALFTELTKEEQELLTEIRQKKMQLLLEIQVVLCLEMWTLLSLGVLCWLFFALICIAVKFCQLSVFFVTCIHIANKPLVSGGPDILFSKVSWNCPEIWNCYEILLIWQECPKIGLWCTITCCSLLFLFCGFAFCILNLIPEFVYFPYVLLTCIWLFLIVVSL